MLNKDDGGVEDGTKIELVLIVGGNYKKYPEAANNRHSRTNIQT